MSKGKKALAVISLIIFVLALAFVVYKLFRVREVTVTGCETLSEEYVISLSEVEYDKFIFEVDTQQILDAIDIEPYIKPVSATIVYPDGVEINIEERKISAYIKKGDTALFIDEECTLLEVLPHAEAGGYPVVIGLQIDECQVGHRICVRDVFLLDVLSNILAGATTKGVSLTSIDLSHAADITLETGNGFTVELGDDTDMGTKFAIIRSSLKELEEMGKSSGILDVASGQKAYYREN